MVCGDGDPDVPKTAFNILVEPGEEAVEIGIEGIDDQPLLVGVWSNTMAEDVRAGDAECQHIGHVMLAKLLAGDQRFGKIEFISDAGGRATYFSLKVLRVGQTGFLLGLVETPARIEGRRPVGKLWHVVRGS